MARTQHGILTTAQLYTAGFSRTMIHDAARRGSLHPLFTCVFSVGTPPTSAHQRAMAAVLAGGPGALLSHHWCRWLFGVGRLPNHPPDITTPPGRHQRPGLTLHRTKLTPEPDANHGIPCTRPERMLIDCAPDLTTKDLRRLVNDVQIKRLTTVERIRAAVAAHHGRATSALAAQVPLDQFGATRSLLEDMLLDLARERVLPLPLINQTVFGKEVDFYYPDRHLIVEADGRAFHGTRIATEDDHEWRLDMEARGERVIVVDYRQLTVLRAETGDRLEAVIRASASTTAP